MAVPGEPHRSLGDRQLRSDPRVPDHVRDGAGADGGAAGSTTETGVWNILSTLIYTVLFGDN